jgi:hypothetical protein
MQIFTNLKINLMRFARLAFGFSRLNDLKLSSLHNKKPRSSHAYTANGRSRCWFLAMGQC